MTFPFSCIAHEFQVHDMLAYLLAQSDRTIHFLVVPT